MKVLIIGAQGMLGSELVKVFSDQDLTAWDKDDLDITQPTQVEEKIIKLKPQVVINAAAYTKVNECEENQDLALKVNGVAVGYLAKVCQKLGAILVHYSTDYVFDGQKKEGYQEEDKTNPLSVYGKSKELGERELLKNTDKYYLIRTSWLYGKAGKNFVNTMLKLAQERKEIRAVEDQIGSSTYAKDLAKATQQLIENKKPFGIYHITNKGSCSWYELACEIFRLAKINIKVIPIKTEEYPLPARRPAYSILVNTKLPPARNRKEALEDYLREIKVI